MLKHHQGNFTRLVTRDKNLFGKNMLQFKDMAVFLLYKKCFFALCEPIWVGYLYLSFIFYTTPDLRLFNFNTTFDVFLVFLFKMHKYIFYNETNLFGYMIWEKKILWCMIFLFVVPEITGRFFLLLNKSTCWDKTIKLYSDGKSGALFVHVVRATRAYPEVAERWRRAAAVATLVGV